MCLEEEKDSEILGSVMLSVGEAVVGGWPYWGDLLHHSLFFFILVFIVLVSDGEHSCSLFTSLPLWP